MANDPHMNDPQVENTNDLTPPPAEIVELNDLIAELPAEFRKRLQPAMDRALETAVRRRRILSLVQDALAQLRLDMKYLMFDLEATRRERDDYRRKLEETQG